MGNVKSLFRTARSVIAFCFGASYLVNVFFASPQLDDINAVLMVVVVVLSIVASTGSSRTIGILLFASGIALLAFSQAPLPVWKQALQENSYLIVMFIMIPLLAIPVQRGGYRASLREVFVRHARTNSGYYALVSVMSAFVGVLISIAAVPLTYEIARASRLSEDKELISSALSRGFATCMIWAPTSATIALVVQLTGIAWMDYFPFALACAGIAGAIGFLMAFAKERADANPSVAVDEPGRGFDGRKTIELGAFALLLLVSVAAISQISGLSILVVVALASLVFPIAWMAVIGRLSAYAEEFRGDYFTVKLPQLKNQIVLFVGAGLFAVGIGYSHAGDALAALLLSMTGQNVLLLTVAIIGITLATSAVGVHPIAVIAVAGGVMSASGCVTPIYMALVLSISWAMGNVVCPASANVIAVSDMVGQSPVRVGLQWNGPYVLVATAVLVVALTMARAVGLI